MRVDLKHHSKYAALKRNRAALLQMDDEELMDRFQSGTVEAFNILVDRYAARLQHYLYRFIHDAVRCEDMVQETFLRVYRNRHSYRRIARFSTWLYTIAGNLGRSEYRKQKRHRVYSIQSVSRDDESYELPLPDVSRLPDDVLAMDMQMERLREALGELPETFREVVVLRDIQQLTYEEVAEITGLPMGTVKSRIHRGRTLLRRLLGDVYPYGRPEPPVHASEETENTLAWAV